MKATGVIRRIDNLGRIVIPKEIRKTLRIQNGDNLEIFMDENENILLKKYSQINKLNEIAQNITDSISNGSNTVFITNNDEFIAGSGKLKNNYLNKKISNDLINILNKRNIISKINDKIKLSQDDFTGNFIINPIIAAGDAVGLVIILDNDDNDVSIVKIITSFLAKYIEQ